MNNNFRCNCPITSALDIVGDKWTLVIIKQMLLEGKKHLRISPKAMKPLLPIFYPQDLKCLKNLK